MRVVASESYQRFIRWRARYRRAHSGEPPAVRYFHEVSDPFSHLAVQRLDALREKYSLTFHVHLASSAAPAYRGDAARYDEWARSDAASVAAGFGVKFPDAGILPKAPAINEAASLLQNRVGDHDFASAAIEIGRALWSGELEGIETAPDLSAGNALRAELGHYAGAMFWFDGEWYWGLDRLELLEQRLIEEGFGEGEPLLRRPHIDVPAGSGKDLKLEVFPSLRSPYTAISFDRVMAIADNAAVEIEIRPVMPMMLRGVPAPRLKALLEANVQDMLAAGLWGVPSFRLSGGDMPPFSCWGQDRLWRVAQEITKRSGGSSS
jgi:2-hydroxychromene-2-carboxylate isomerase